MEKHPFPQVSRFSLEVSLQSIVGLFLSLGQTSQGKSVEFLRYYTNSLRNLSRENIQNSKDFRKIADYLETLSDRPEFSFYFSQIKGPQM